MEELKSIKGSAEDAAIETEPDPVLSDYFDFDTLFRVKGESGIFMVRSYTRHGTIMQRIPRGKQVIAGNSRTVERFDQIVFETNKRESVTLKEWIDMMFDETGGGIIEIKDIDGMRDHFGLPDNIIKRVVGYYNDMIKMVRTAQEKHEQKNNNGEEEK